MGRSGHPGGNGPAAVLPRSGRDSDASDSSVRLCYLGSGGDRDSAILDSFEASRYELRLIASPGELRVETPDEIAVVVVDGDDQPDMLATLLDIADSTPDARIMVLAEFESGDEVLMALEAGASGVCDSTASPEAIIRTVDDIVNSGAAIPRAFAADLVSHLRKGPGYVVQGASGPVELTGREWEVLTQLRLGRTTNEIAEALYVSPGTIRSHVWALVHKFGVEDRQSLIDLF